MTEAEVREKDRFEMGYCFFEDGRKDDEPRMWEASRT